MDYSLEKLFHDIPIIESTNSFFNTLLQSREDRILIINQLLQFYSSEQNIIIPDIDKNLYEKSIDLLLITFSYLILLKDNDSFDKVIRRFIFESKNDNQDLFQLKIFFLSNFDSREEYFVQNITSHEIIQHRINILLSKYVDFFKIYLIK